MCSVLSAGVCSFELATLHFSWITQSTSSLFLGLYLDITTNLYSSHGAMPPSTTLMSCCNSTLLYSTSRWCPPQSLTQLPPTHSLTTSGPFHTSFLHGFKFSIVYLRIKTCSMTAFGINDSSQLDGSSAYPHLPVVSAVLVHDPSVRSSASPQILIK